MSLTCCRDASSGTTPPHSRWISTCEAMTLDRICHGRAGSSISATTAAAVSSHELSIPSTCIGTVGTDYASASRSVCSYGARQIPRSVMIAVT